MSIINILNSINDSWEDKGDTLITYVIVPGISLNEITVDTEGSSIHIRGSNGRLGLKVNKLLDIPNSTTNPRFTYENGLLIFTVDKVILPKRRLDVVPNTAAILH